jgi:hypothetical protein
LVEEIKRQASHPLPRLQAEGQVDDAWRSSLGLDLPFQATILVTRNGQDQSHSPGPRSFIERPRQALVFELLLEARPDELVALTLAIAFQDVTILLTAGCGCYASDYSAVFSAENCPSSFGSSWMVWFGGNRAFTNPNPVLVENLVIGAADGLASIPGRQSRRPVQDHGALQALVEYGSPEITAALGRILTLLHTLNKDFVAPEDKGVALSTIMTAIARRGLDHAANSLSPPFAPQSSFPRSSPI